MSYLLIISKIQLSSFRVSEAITAAGLHFLWWDWCMATAVSMVGNSEHSWHLLIYQSRSKLYIEYVPDKETLHYLNPSFVMFSLEIYTYCIYWCINVLRLRSLTDLLPQYIGVETKWPPFSWMKIHFLAWRLSSFDWNFGEIYSQGSK